MKTIIISLLLGIVVLIAVTVPWSGLAAINLRISPRIPWSAPVMVAYLAALLWYLNGSWRPKTTQVKRRQLLRLRWLSGGEWCFALIAGGLGVLALWLAYAAVGGLSRISASRQEPALTTPVLLIAITMSAAVSAIGEEAGFRGYMQSNLENSFRPAIAIFIVSIAFALLHLSHGVVDLARNGVFYFAASVVYGLQASFTRSILPSLILHFVGDLFLFALRSALISVHVPASAWVNTGLAIGAIVLCLGSVAMFVCLARATFPRTAVWEPTTSLENPTH
jgi:membrane protease YdiL (CAAX protease family)